MKKKTIILFLIVIFSAVSLFVGCTSTSEGSDDNGLVDNPSQVGVGKINVTFVSNGNGTGEVMSVTMYENTSTDYILDRLPSANFPCDFDNERTFAYHTSSTLRSCPENLEVISTIKAGEIFLAGGGQLRFYLSDVVDVSFNMTRIGFIEDMSGFSSALEKAEEYASSEEMDFWGNDIYFRIALN